MAASDSSSGVVARMTSKSHSELRDFIERADPTSIGMWVTEFDMLVKAIDYEASLRAGLEEQLSVADARVRELEALNEKIGEVVTETATENARLREALERIAEIQDQGWIENGRPEDGEVPPWQIPGTYSFIARAALADPFLPIGHPTC